MPGYVENAITKFQQQELTKPQHAPSAWTQPVYRRTVQEPIPDNNAKQLDAKAITRLQQIVGTLLYYAQAVYPTMLVALGTLAEEQTKGTTNTALAAQQLLDYAATHPDATLQYTASDMQLHIDSNASYLSMPQAHSRAGGYFYLSARLADPTSKPTTTPPLNGAVHVLSHKMRNVLALAAEAEIGALFENGQTAVAIRNTLQDLGHPQMPTPIKTDNTTANGFANNTMKQRKSCAMDMRYYWIQDRIHQKQFLVYWQPGSENLADYFTKHHPASHHREQRNIYLVPSANGSKYAYKNMPTMLQGCVKHHPARTDEQASTKARYSPHSASPAIFTSQPSIPSKHNHVTTQIAH